MATLNVARGNTGTRSAGLLVFAKKPVAGTVKTRLTPFLSATEAADLYAAFLRDALEQYAALDADVRLYYAPEESGAAGPPVPEGVTVHTQEGAELGARLEAAFAGSFACGYSRLVVIGTDHPTLPSGYLRSAYQALDVPGRVVIGPSDDGGFYLLGIDRPRPELFAGMRYSHDGVFADTLARISAAGAPTTVLPTWYDVDTPEALRRLADDLHKQPDIAPRTGRVLRRLRLA